MKRTIYLLIIILIGLTGCQQNTMVEDEPEEDTLVEVIEESAIEDEEVIESPLSGESCDDEDLLKRPVAIMFDNHPDARWQRCLSEAEVIYEIPVEGTYTRYMGIYLVNEPSGDVGSIRSARPYFVSLAKGYGAVYVHAGGSEQAKSDIREWELCDMDAIVAHPSEFWRVEHKSMPHDLYTSFQKIREFEERSYDSVEGPFNQEFGEFVDLETVGDTRYVQIDYFHDNKTAYRWDDEAQAYSRYKDGQLHIDESNQQAILADNIIILNTNSQVLDGEGRLQVDVIGEGTGTLISRGEQCPIIWSKKSFDSPISFSNEDGSRIKLTRGATWIQVLDQRNTINFEGGDTNDY